LSAAINKISDYDLIFCGRQAGDWDSGQVGSGIAEILGIPSVTVAKKIDIADGKATVERVTSDGYEIIETSLPALITVSNELGEPRYPTIKGIMAAKKKDVVVWKPADIGIDAAQTGASGRRTRLIKLFQPAHEIECELIEAETAEEAAVNLALKLREAKVL
jgi:electron transfer flavoprotein beta subunit